MIEDQNPFTEYKNKSPILNIKVSCTELFDDFNKAFEKAHKFVLEKKQPSKELIQTMEWTRREFVDRLVQIHKKQNPVANSNKIE